MAYPDDLDNLKDDWKGKNLPEGELGDILTADSYNDHAKASNAIETELGTLPKWNKADVKTLVKPCRNVEESDYFSERVTEIKPETADMETTLNLRPSGNDLYARINLICTPDSPCGTVLSQDVSARTLQLKNWRYAGAEKEPLELILGGANGSANDFTNGIRATQKFSSDVGFAVGANVGQTSTHDVITALQFSGTTLQYKKRTLTYTGGIITTVGDESDWIDVPSV